jgi:hypothetical protein
MLGRFRGELPQVLGLLGEEGVPLEAEGGGAPGKLGPAAAGRAAGRRRVDQENRGANGRL